MLINSKKTKLFFKLSFLFLLINLLFACNHQEQLSPKTITVAGSTTILPISEHWAYLFFKQSGQRVLVQGGGSTHGIDLVKKGKVEIGASSRELSLEESKGLSKVPICKDILAVIVNSANPVRNISSENLKKVFSGEITNWKELGGSDLKIQVINRESGSGTRSTFREKIMCSSRKACSSFSLSALVMNSNYEVRKSVSSAENSIGYLSFGFVPEETVKVRALQIDKEKLDSKKYKLFRELYYLLSEQTKTEATKAYLDFIKSPLAQAELAKEGFQEYY